MVKINIQLYYIEGVVNGVVRVNMYNIVLKNQLVNDAIKYSNKTQIEIKNYITFILCLVTIKYISPKLILWAERIFGAFR